MNESATAVRQAVNLGLSALLKSQGFKKTGLTWRRARGATEVQVVQVQTAAGGWAFTINVGVYFPEVQLLEGWVLTDSPTVVDCSVDERIGFLMPELEDTWWGVGSDAALEDAGRDIVRAMSDYALPWLDTHLDPSVCAATRFANTGQQASAAAFREVASRRQSPSPSAVV